MAAGRSLLGTHGAQAFSHQLIVRSEHPGADRLTDIAMLRAEPQLYGPVASGSDAVSRPAARLAADAPQVLTAIRSPRLATQKRARALPGANAPVSA